jgi:glutamine synthetase
MLSAAEYIWLDGAKPTARLRSKSRVLLLKDNVSINDFPEWSYDGSSTFQAPGDRSDLVLKPVNFVDDPLRGAGNYLVMCEVFHVDGKAIASNSRAALRELSNKVLADLDAWIGFEQEYTFFQDGRPYGWPKNGFPEPQGPFYCGVGADRIFGRNIVEDHLAACIDAGIRIFGINAEVMPAQWEFQIGYRGNKGEACDPLSIADHVWLARWLLQRIAEDHDVNVSFDNKPMKGDWNGAGMHTNFSTKNMRDAKKGWLSIESMIKTLEKRHFEHIKHYGAGLAERLTGHHETCDINSFRSGSSDRGASVRIPCAVAKDKCGYIEDRRPGANADPYAVAYLLLEASVIAEGKSKDKSKAKKSAVMA